MPFLTTIEEFAPSWRDEKRKSWLGLRTNIERVAIQNPPGLEYFDTVTEILVRVEPGTESDGASIPWFARWPFTPDRQSLLRQAFIHDELHRRQRAKLHGEWIKVTRSLADAIFRRAMEEEGVNFLGRWTVWAGLRIGGWVAWNRSRRALAS